MPLPPSKARNSPRLTVRLNPFTTSGSSFSYLNHSPSAVMAGSSGYTCRDSAGSSPSGWPSANPVSQSRPSRTVTGQCPPASGADAQIRIGVGMARNIECPAPRRIAPTSAGLPVQSSRPRSMTATRLANGKASSSRCSVNTTVVPSSRLIFPSVAKKSAAAMGSS